MDHGVVLALLDFSPATRDVIATADRLAAMTGARLLLVHVAEPFDPMLQRPPHLMGDVMEDCRRECWETSPDRISVLVPLGDPLSVISDIVQTYPVTTICLGPGSRQRRPGSFGSVISRRYADKVLRVERLRIGGSGHVQADESADSGRRL